jgi:uncharacterized protein involved in outer membrane biogenesis
VWQAYLQERISDAVGASVAFEKLSVSPFRGIVDGRKLVARVDDAATPFLTVERVQLKVKMGDLLAKRLAIETILLERPAVVIERGGDGTTNLPAHQRQAAPAVPTSGLENDDGGTAWAAGVRQVILTDGSLSYRDQSAGFDGYTLQAGPIHLQFDHPAGSVATLSGTIARLHRLDLPAEFGQVRVVGEGGGLHDLRNLQTVTGKLSLDADPLLRLDVQRQAAATTIELALKLAVTQVVQLLPAAWASQVPAFALGAESDVQVRLKL